MLASLLAVNASLLFTSVYLTHFDSLFSGHTNRVYSLQFDGVHVVSGSLDTSIRVWDVETGACRHALMVR